VEFGLFFGWMDDWRCDVTNTIKASEYEVGKWYEDQNGKRLLCIGPCLDKVGFKSFISAKYDIQNNSTWEFKPLPDCTGWDWQPPKPEKKYRPFANAAEFMPHRGRWVYLLDDPADQLLICSFGDLGIFYLQSLTTWEAMFSQAKFDDDGTPFGVEVTE
jgi:hypothetical protein